MKTTNTLTKATTTITTTIKDNQVNCNRPSRHYINLSLSHFQSHVKPLVATSVLFQFPNTPTSASTFDLQIKYLSHNDHPLLGAKCCTISHVLLT